MSLARVLCPARHLLAQRGLQTATFIFRECEGLISIDVFVKGSGKCQALRSVTFDFEGCEGLTSIDEFGKDVRQYQALQLATFSFGGVEV